jgi:hypothetical protein
MRCVVFGATGYVGGRLVPELVRTGQAVRAAGRDVGKLADVPWRDSAELVSSDVSDAPASPQPLRTRRLCTTWSIRCTDVTRRSGSDWCADRGEGGARGRRGSDRVPGRNHSSRTAAV